MSPTNLTEHLINIRQSLRDLRYELGGSLFKDKAEKSTEEIRANNELSESFKKIQEAEMWIGEAIYKAKKVSLAGNSSEY